MRKYFMRLHNKFNSMSKISLVPHEDVQKHLANNSPAKVSFRFSKSKRFKDNNPECPIAFYSYASQLSRRKSAIGTEKKFDFDTILPATPASTQYNTNSYYEFTKFKGLSFGLSREQSPDRSYLIPQIHKHPGPDAVKIMLLSMTTRSLQKLHLLTLSGLRRLIRLRGICHIRRLQDQEPTRPLSSISLR